MLQLAADAYKQLSDYDKERFVVAFQELQDNVHGVAADPTYVPPPYGPMPAPDPSGAGGSSAGQAPAPAGAGAGADLAVHARRKESCPVEVSSEDEDMASAAGADLPVQARQGRGATAGADLPVQGRKGLLFWLSAHTVEWASEMIKGVDNYFMCRSAACRFFAPPTCWLQEIDLALEPLPVPGQDPVPPTHFKWHFCCPHMWHRVRVRSASAALACARSPVCVRSVRCEPVHELWGEFCGVCWGGPLHKAAPSAATSTSRTGRRTAGSRRTA
jgi:hypothetical protein